MAIAAVRDAAALGYRRIVIEGGEPLLAASLHETLACARRHHLHTALVTNGTLLHLLRDPRALIDACTVEVHGLGAAHNAAVQREGAFAHTTERLALLRGAQLPFTIRLLATPGNLGTLPDVVTYAASQGAAGVEVCSSWRAGVSDTALVAALSAARPVACALRVDLRSDLIEREALLLLREHFVPSPHQRHVTAVTPALAIAPSGVVSPLCRSLPSHLAVGSLHRARLVALTSAWLHSDRPRALIEACDRAWWSAVAPDAPCAMRWAEELALHVAAPKEHRVLSAA
jgi:MoaA/NifB/PqqE/SkfB family radical SAM enzyme